MAEKSLVKFDGQRRQNFENTYPHFVAEKNRRDVTKVQIARRNRILYQN